MFTIHLAKEPFKFSCSHFTILASDRAERLHGHNYQVQVDIQVSHVDQKLGFAFDFNLIKPLIRRICDEFDERILIPENSPYLNISSEQSNVSVSFGTKQYSFPIEDILSLPVANITSEELARHICKRLSAQMSKLEYWTNLSVQVEETRGQSVSFSVQR